jgi:ribosomal protein S17E
METKNAKKTSGLFEETGKTGELINSSVSAMMDMYKKQLNMVFDFYNNIFNSTMNAGKAKSNFNWNLNPFLTGSNNHKLIFNPLSWLRADGEYTNTPISVYQNFFKEISDFNKNWLDAFQSTYNLRQNDWGELNEEYQQLLEDNRTAVKDMTDNLINSYNKQLDFSVESNKKLLSELNRLMEKAVRSNLEFWENSIKKYTGIAKNEEKAPKIAKKETHQHSEAN